MSDKNSRVTVLLTCSGKIPIYQKEGGENKRKIEVSVASDNYIEIYETVQETITTTKPFEHQIGVKMLKE